MTLRATTRAWAAVRAIGEARDPHRLRRPGDLRAYILSDDFALDGFKGAA